MFLLASVAFSATITRNYTHIIQPSTTAYVNTDLDISPTLTSSNTYCTNATYNPSLSVTPRWYVSAYATALTSTVAAPACVYPETAVNMNQPMNWLSSSQYSAFNAYPSPFGHSAPVISLPDFASFLSGQGITNPTYSIEKSRYLGLGMGFINYSGNFYYKANSTLWCYGQASILSSYSSYSRGPLTYYGSNPSFPAIVLNQPGIHTFNYTFLLNGCISGVRTYINPSYCSNAENVYFYKNTSFPYTFASAQKTINVSNPFVCNITGVISPGNATNGTTFPFTLVLTNNGNLPITVSAITLQAGSQFSNLVINTPAMPFTINNGATATVSGTVTAPNAGGIYPLTFFVNAGSSSADCSGSVKNCDANISRSFSVTNNTSSSIISLNCSFYNHSNSFTPGEWAWARANCFQSGSLVNCPILNWATNMTGGSLNPTQTPAGTSPRQSNFSLSPAAPTPQSGRAVTVSCQNASLCNASCNISANATPTSLPLQITCGLVNHSSTFTPGDWAYVQANCTQGGSTVNCPTLNWTTNITQGSLNPVQTIPGPSPRQSNFSILSTAPTPQSGRVGIVCANPANCTASCNVSVNVTPAIPLIDLICYIFNHSNTFTPGDWAWARANCSRAGAPILCPTLNWATNITGAMLNPAQTMPGANPRQSNFSISPSAPTPQAGKINVSCQNASACSAACNISNVAIGQGIVLSCGIVNHSSIFFPGEWAMVQVNCTQGGVLTTCPALDWNTGLPGASLNPNHTNQTSIPPWALSNFSYAGSWYSYMLGNITVQCSNPLLCITSCLVQLNTSMKPTACNMTFSPPRNPPVFAPNDSSMTNVTCYKPPPFNLTLCPSFAWSTNISGAQFTPNSTPPSLVSQSNFSTHNSPVSTGYARVVSTNPLVPLTCSIPGGVSVVPALGPDYIIVNVTPSKQVAFPGETISIFVSVKNSGNQPGTLQSITRLGGNCTLQDKPTDPLPPNQVASLTFTCSCPQVAGLVPYVANATADATNVIPEYNELNNWGIGAFLCMQQALSCQYFV